MRQLYLAWQEFIMAMELFVLSDKQLNSVADWQAAVAGEGYPLLLEGTTPVQDLKGFLPAKLRDTKTGFECNPWPAREFMSEMRNVNFDHEWAYVLAFRWGGNLSQVPAVWMAAAAYAKATDGVVLDEQGSIHTASEARTIVEDVEREMPQVEAMLRTLNESSRQNRK
jgi:hypothetical protein